MAVLGSGDIIHHCHRKVSCSYALRHDYSLKRGTHFYFWTTYICVLAITIGACNF